MRQNAPLRGWIVTVMLCLFMAVNFADKAAFGLAAIPIMREMHLTHMGFGLLAAGFFALFSISALLAGFLGDRLSTKWLLAGMALVWTAAQLPLLAPLRARGIFRVPHPAGRGRRPSAADRVACRVQMVSGFAPPVRFGDCRIRRADRRGGCGAARDADDRRAGLAFFAWRVGLRKPDLVRRLAFCGRRARRRRTGARGQPESQARIPLSSVLVNRTVIGITVIAFSAYWVSSLAIIWLPSF